MSNFQMQLEDRDATDVHNFIEVELAIRQMNDMGNAFVILSHSIAIELINRNNHRQQTILKYQKQ